MATQGDDCDGHPVTEGSVGINAMDGVHDTVSSSVGASENINQEVSAADNDMQDDSQSKAANQDDDSNSEGRDDNVEICNGSTDNTTSNNDNEAPKEQPTQQADQPIIQHTSPPQDDISSSEQDINPSAPTSINANQSNNTDVDNIARVIKGEKNRSNLYTSAPTSVLGNDSDRNDFCRGAPPPSSDDKGVETSASQDNGGNTLTKLKQWFTAPTETTSSPEEGNESSAHDYHNFASPNPDVRTDDSNSTAKKISAKDKEAVRKIALNDNGYDESLLNEEEKERAASFSNEDNNGEGDVEMAQSGTAKSPRKRTWRKSSSQQLSGTEEEERVMGECSFFYDMNNEHDERTTPSRRIPCTESQANENDDEEQQGYFEQRLPHYHNRRINPRAMAQAIKTRAKRQWTERRYRRRLRQSQLGLSARPYNGGDAVDSNNINQANVDEFTYELTKEHRQAFQAAHSALNGKLANEYGRNRHAIRKQFGYGYDFDHYDLELADDDSGRDGGGEGEIRADLTKSSLAIRGGLIRLPTDNVRLVCDSQLQPGILSIETRDVGGGAVGYENYGNANRYGPNIHGTVMMANAHPPNPNENGKHNRQRASSKDSIADHQWSRQELAYVLTVDEQIYQRIVREMGDSYRVPCGMYYCCHGATESGDHVGIGVAVVIMLVVFGFFIAGMIAWPTW